MMMMFIVQNYQKYKNFKKKTEVNYTTTHYNLRTVHSKLQYVVTIVMRTVEQI